MPKFFPEIDTEVEVSDGSIVLQATNAKVNLVWAEGDGGRRVESIEWEYGNREIHTEVTDGKSGLLGLVYYDVTPARLLGHRQIFECLHGRIAYVLHLYDEGFVCRKRTDDNGYELPSGKPLFPAIDTDYNAFIENNFELDPLPDEREDVQDERDR